MIRNERDYEESRRRLADGTSFLADQKAALLRRGLKPAEVARALAPMRSFQAQIEDDIRWYERARRGDFTVLRELTGLGRLLIAARIARGWTQRRLAERLGVSEAQVSRDERNEYHGITVDRTQRILDALGVGIAAQLLAPRSAVPPVPSSMTPELQTVATLVDDVTALAPSITRSRIIPIQAPQGESPGWSAEVGAAIAPGVVDADVDAGAELALAA